jgi:hypothetical protein
MGMWRATLDHGQVQFINEQFQSFDGIVQPGSIYSSTFNIPQNTLVASVSTAWGPMTSLNDLSLAVYNASGVKQGESNAVNQPGLTGKRERVALKLPPAGAYQARIANTLGLVGTLQTVLGSIELTRAEYSPVSDIGGLSGSAQADIYQVMRTYEMSAYGRNFRPGFGVSRGDLASALVLAGRAPQYLAAQPAYADSRDAVTRIFVESVQNAPSGAFFSDVTAGGNFRPFDRVDRLTAAVVLVRAAGFGSEVSSAQPLTIMDASAVPSSLRGYVSVAISHGLLTPSGALFNPQAALTRADLAHALAVMNSGS